MKKVKRKAKDILIDAGFRKTENGYSDGDVTLSENEFFCFCKMVDDTARETGSSAFKVIQVMMKMKLTPFSL